MKKYSRFFAVMLFMVLLSGLMSLIGPICLQVWDAQGMPLTVRRVLLVVLILIGTNLLNVLLIVYRERFAKGFNQKNFLYNMANLLHMDYDSLITDGPTNLLEKIVNSVNSIYSYMTGMHIQIWASVAVAAVSLLLIARLNIMLCLFMLADIPVSYFGYRLLNKELAKRSQEMQTQTGMGFQELISYLQEPDYYKQLPDDRQLLQRMLPAVERVYGSMARLNEFAQSASSALQGIGTLLQNLVMMLVVYSFYENAASPYMLMIATIVLPLYFSAVGSITNSHISKTDYDVALSLQQGIAGKVEPEAGRSLDAVERMEFDVEHLKVAGKELSFDAHATLKKGDIARICGESGSGKSTLARTLVKFRPIDGVKLNGTELAEFSPSSVREKVEYVSQNIPIIRGTLRDNLCFGKPVDAVSDDFFLHNSLLQSILTHKKLDDEILEGGANLSGGEKQKIAIVRALLSNPEVLVLDEVCSNIDAETSNEIYELLKRERKKRITILITHDELPDGLVNIEMNRPAAAAV